jgi:hypothetical protein
MNLIDIAAYSRRHFFFFVNKCNQLYRSGHDLRLYREIIDMHRNSENIEDLLENEVFLRKLHETLGKWNMDQRRAQLSFFEDFKRSIKFWKDYLVKLYQYKIYENIDNDMHEIEEMLEKIFCNVKIMQSKRRIVGVSKTLHFLLPDLIMPIDGKFTMSAIYGYNKFSNTPEKEFVTFRQILREFLEITDRLQLSQADVDGKNWNTSVPKLIDNSIIGLMKSEIEEIRSLF